MEEHLKRESEFTAEALSRFFADAFVIITNNRVVQATPATYRAYLYQLKNTLDHVSYVVAEFIEFEEGVAVPFVIEMHFCEKPSQKLQVISIFKLNAANRITEWREVFADANDQSYNYDPKV